MKEESATSRNPDRVLEIQIFMGNISINFYNKIVAF